MNSAQSPIRTEKLPVFFTIPHSGEQVPEETPWLSSLDEVTLMRDVDRYVDHLYKPALSELELPVIIAPWHRYVADLNRLPSDLDPLSVEGAEHASSFSVGMGVHWAETTHGETLMPKPMSQELHELIIKKYHQPFHDEVEAKYSEIKAQGYKQVYHLDLHSMPSLGTKKHRDPGETRAEVVISDVEGKSCDGDFKDKVISAFEKAGFQVAYNWPYKGGRVTERYGKPSQGQHAIQVELNRSLYMNEETKKLESSATQVQERLKLALTELKSWFELKNSN